MDRFTDKEVLGEQVAPPDLTTVLEHAERDVPLGRMDEGGRQKARNALEPFRRLAAFIAEKRGLPYRILLGEIAVIQDTRLIVEAPAFASHEFGATPSYFASAIVSYVDTMEKPILLSAWNAAIEDLKKEADSEKTRTDGLRMIVPNCDTYRNAALLENLSAVVEWPKRIGTSDHANNRKDFDEVMVERSAAYLSRYKYPDPISDGQKVDESVTFLLRALVRKVRLARKEESSGQINVLLDRLEKAALLIVPFKRPRLGRQTMPGDPGEPGGCLFLLVEIPNAPDTGERDTGGLEEFILPASWLLTRAALQEAHTEIEVRNRSQKLLATVTHFLPTETGNMRHELFRARDAAKRESASGVVQRRLQQAIEYSNRLDQAVGFALHAWKFSQQKDIAKTVESGGTRINAEEFRRELEKVFADCWREVKEFLEGRYHDEYGQELEPDSKPSQVGPAPEIDDSSWQELDPVFREVWWREQYTRSVCKEALLNAQSHGQGAVTVRLGADDYGDERHVWLEINNPLEPLSRAEELARKAVSAQESHIGMSVLLLAARAWNLPKPEFRVESGKFSVRLYIAKAFAPPEGGSRRQL